MKLIKSLFCFLIFSSSIFSQDNTYVLGEDSLEQENVPKGNVIKFVCKSDLLKETHRECYIYVPAQYNPNKAAALMVFQDGHAYVNKEGDFRVPIVFDNLIHKKEMPITIGLFVNPGHNSSDLPENPFKASNRSEEYDSLNDSYVSFLIEELIPEISKTFNLTTDPKMRVICGLSSGGICAFTAAWERPDYFKNVISHIGSFTNIRGGHNYEAMIRKTPKKDIKVYLQDGTNDLDNEHGNWWLANLQMASSLKYKSYEYLFVKGIGKHDGKHGGSVFPEAVKWIWSDYRK